VSTLHFQSSDGTWVMRITADRRIEVNEDVEVTKAARAVLDALQHLLTPAVPVQVRDYSCKVCGNKPGADGVLEHGSGCYTQSEDGGGSEFIPDAVTTPPAAQRQRVVFPTMLRKMWSGREVQAWLDEHVNKEKNA
jgi:hypothetical protein